MDIYKSYKIKCNQKRFVDSVIIGDLHHPYHSQRCVALLFSFLEWLKPETIILNGDIIDFYALSRFDKNPKRITSLQQDVDITVDFIKNIRHILPDVEVIYLEGNHETRLDRWLVKHPEVSSLRALSVQNLLELDHYGIEYIKYDDWFYRHNFLFHHGDIVRQKSAYTANFQMDKWRVSGICNHTHRLGASYLTTFGFEGVWYENGCLCQRHQEYTSGVNNWQQGFSVFHWDNVTRQYKVDQNKILEEGFYYNDYWFSCTGGH